MHHRTSAYWFAPGRCSETGNLFTGSVLTTGTTQLAYLLAVMVVLTVLTPVMIHLGIPSPPPYYSLATLKAKKVWFNIGKIFIMIV